MTEPEYINATNLAKLRIASAILREVRPQRGEEEAYIKGAQVHLVEFIEWLEDKLDAADAD